MESLTGKLASPAAYTDFSALADLRASATSTSSAKKAEANREVAKQFEALFIQMMLKSMRDATYINKEGESDQTRFYQDMFDKQIALDLANREQGGIGLAKVMQQQLSGKSEKVSVSASNSPSTDNSTGAEMLRLRQKVNQLSKFEAVNLTDIKSISTDNTVEASNTESVNSPAEFITAVRPHAEAAASKLGVRAEVLIAQSALETGWGNKMIRHPDGHAANNLFGIKADQRWSGEYATVSTLEYSDGIATRQIANFRSYASIADSFDDYADFIQSSPRYQQAVEVAGNNGAYLNALQQAGYSTDPQYAEKIKSIIERLDSYSSESDKGSQQLAFLDNRKQRTE